jgi:hypothetical protein
MTEEKIESGWKMMLKITGFMITFIVFSILIKYFFGL